MVNSSCIPTFCRASDHAEDLSIHPLFHQYAPEGLHQRTNPILGPIGKMVVQHQPLPKQRRVRLFFVGGPTSLRGGGEAEGSWIRQRVVVVRKRRRGPVSDGTCAVSDRRGSSARTRALRGRSQVFVYGVIRQ